MDLFSRFATRIAAQTKEEFLAGSSPVFVFIDLFEPSPGALSATTHHDTDEDIIEGEEGNLPFGETGGIQTMSTQIQPFEMENKEEFIIGRSPDCELMLEHPKVSRKHAVIKGNLEDGFQISDLGSINGTFLQNKALAHNTPTPVGFNERIVIANLVKCKLHPADWVYDQAVLLKKDMDALFDSRS